MTPIAPQQPPARPAPTAGEPHHNHRNHPRQTLKRLLGPGIVAGAADDDPSGIATYSQAGAQYGFNQLWTVVITLPFMIAIQMIAARIGRASGEGLLAAAARRSPPALITAIVGLVLFANVINIAADLAAMGEAVRLVLGGSPLMAKIMTVVFGLVCVSLEIYVSYRRYAGVLKWLTMVLFVYVAAVLTIHIPWGEVLQAVINPTISWTSDYALTMVAVFGTTISPYVFIWQAGQEVEELKLHRARPLRDSADDASGHIRRIRWDTGIGMAFSNIISFAIILTTAATLHVQGINTINTAAEAAEALRPIAGVLTFALFACGIIGTGLLAVPVLAGASAYAVSEPLHWRASLAAKPLEAIGFYGIIAAATFGGVAITLLGIDPIRMLFWAAVINGFAAVPIMIGMMLLSQDRETMGVWTLPPSLKLMGWIATLIMAISVLVLMGAELS
jgi:NRAMP (natural resistance-associated macrophage protein)-like metal ion transporter